MNKNLIVVTGNKGKAEEIAKITGWSVEARGLDIPEVQSLDVETVARAKALAAYEIVKQPVVVDDSGMTLSALHGLPGALAVWFMDALGPAGLLKLVADEEDRRATVETCMAYADEHGVQTFVGRVDGTLTRELRGSNGFGYDPIFVPNGSDRTYAEMTNEEKNQISMRKLALEKLKRFLTS